jgi:hypothetical protein
MGLISRINWADKLFNDAVASYRVNMRCNMNSGHQKWVRDGITWAVCEYYGKNRKMNDVFRRAAIIALGWARGSPSWQLFDTDSLIACLRQFLRREGAEPAPCADPFVARREIQSVLGICANPNWSRTCSITKLLDKLQRCIAKHWACSWSNHKGKFGCKWCHF